MSTEDRYNSIYTGTEIDAALGRIISGDIDEAVKKAGEARAGAEAAQTKAETAQAAAETARQGAEAAKTKAGTAQAAAETARQGAEAAKTKAETAQTAAEAAKTAAQQAAAEASASAQQAAESAAALSGTIDDVSDLKAGLAKNTEADAAAKRSLDALWKLNQGISYQFETDATEAYSKTVPTGAKCADVQMIGGKSMVWNQFVNKSKFAESSGIFTNNGDGSVTANGTASSLTRFVFDPQFTGLLTVGHKYYFGGISGGSASTYYLRAWGGYAVIYNAAIIALSQAAFLDGNKTFDLMVSENAAVDVTVRPFVFDLTAIFGFGNEPTSTNDPRIAFIEQYAAAHPEYNAGELVSADVESVKYNDSVVCEIPESVRALLGYGLSAGDVYNSIERTDKGWQYVQRVGSVDIGTLTFGYDATNKNFYSTGLSSLIKSNTNDEIANIICHMYAAISRNSFVGISLAADKLTFVNASKTICFRNLAYTDAAAFKAAMSGVMLYYELATPVITDITDMMTFDFDAVPVEAGGTVTFDNSAQLAVPNSVEYAVSLAEVNG